MQRKINETGGMQANCILSLEALNKRISTADMGLPSLILVDESMMECISLIKAFKPAFSTPLYVITKVPDDTFEDECYEKGITGVLQWPLTDRTMSRVYTAALQYETGRQYERILQRQTRDLETAREIFVLNQQLESRNAFLHQIFGKYFSEEVLEMILEDPKGGSIGGEKKELAILISDLRGFSALAEEMNPDTMTELLNRYFGQMAEIISSFKGTVIEFMGDGILAVFGAPIHNDNIWENSVAAAIRMQNAMTEINDFAMGLGVDGLSMGIGVHCGEAFIGNVGTEKMMRYNVLGRTVNVCSRVESVSIGGQVLISGDLYEKLGNAVRADQLTKVYVKGLSRHIEIYQVKSCGDYMLKENESDKFVEPVEKILILVQIISEKIVNQQQIPAKMMKISHRSMIVADLENMDYTDVKFVGVTEDGTELFSDCYGKAVTHTSGETFIHYTKLSRGLKDYICSLNTVG